MRLLYAAFLFYLTSQTALAGQCTCFVQAYDPLTGPGKNQAREIGDFEGRYYGLYDETSQKSCREDCRNSFLRNYPHYSVKETLLSLGDQLIRAGQHGYNCTGPTTMKFPLTVKAKIGEVPIGNAYSRIYIIHRERSCF